MVKQSASQKMVRQRQVSSLASVIPDYFIRETQFSMSLSAQVALRSDSSRVAIVWGSPTSGNYRISTKSGVTSGGNGYFMTANAAPFLMTWRDWLVLVNAEWWLAGSVSQSITITEILYKPSR